jgi:hypothetical protein
LQALPPSDPSIAKSLAKKFVPRGFIHNWRRYVLSGAVEALAGLLQPGEDLLLISYAKIGVNPVVSAVAGLAYLDIFEPFFLKPHVVALTNRRLLLIQLSIPDYRPKRLTLAEAREAVSVVRARETWFYFSVWVRRRGSSGEVRLNFPYSSWIKEARALVSALATIP